MMMTPPLRYRSVNGYTVSNKGMGSAAANGVLQVVPYAGPLAENGFLLNSFWQVTNKRAVCVILTSIIKHVIRSIDRVHRGVKNFFDRK